MVTYTHELELVQLANVACFLLAGLFACVATLSLTMLIWTWTDIQLRQKWFEKDHPKPKPKKVPEMMQEARIKMEAGK